MAQKSQTAHTNPACNLHNHRDRQACRNIKRQSMRVNHRTSTVPTKPWAVVGQGVRLGVWRAGPGADRGGTLGGPGRRWASFGRGEGGRSTGGGGGPAPHPERGGGPGWGRWRNASTTGPHGAPPGALRKKRESEEGQSSGGGGRGGGAVQKTWNDRI